MAEVVFGKTTTGSNQSAVSHDQILAGAFTATASGTLLRLSYETQLFGYQEANIRGLVYADTGSDQPGTLLATGDIVATTVSSLQYIDLPFSGGEQIAITNGTKYWLGVAWEPRKAPVTTIVYSRTTSTPGNRTYRSWTQWVWSDPIPSTLYSAFGSELYYANQTLAINGTIETGGGGGGPTLVNGFKVWNGSSWDIKPVKVYNGSSWEEKPLKRWDGSAWVPVEHEQ